MEYTSVEMLPYAEMMIFGSLPVGQPFRTVKVDQINPFIAPYQTDVELLHDKNPNRTGVDTGFPLTIILKGGVSCGFKGGGHWTDAGIKVMHALRDRSAGSNRHAMKPTDPLHENGNEGRLSCLEDPVCF